MERGTDTWWDHLVDVLGGIGDVSDRQPHGLVVALDGRRGAVVEIVMTRDEWDDMTGIGGWTMTGGARHVRQLVLDQPHDQRYLVYGLYTLTPSDTPELPTNPVFVRLKKLAEQHPHGIPGAAWVARRRDVT